MKPYVLLLRDDSGIQFVHRDASCFDDALRDFRKDHPDIEPWQVRPHLGGIKILHMDP